ANLMTWIAALILIKPCVKLFMLRRELLLALIIPICAIGAYSARTSMADVWIALAGGFLGYAFHLFRFPAVPVVLGIILAPLADENLRRALMLFENNGLGYFAQQYVGHVLVALIVGVFVEGLLRARRARRAAPAAQPLPQGESAAAAGSS